MNKLIVTLAALCLATALNAQTNTLPTTGNVGIGTLIPSAALSVTSNDDARIDIHSAGNCGIIDTVANSNVSAPRWLEVNPTGGVVFVGIPPIRWTGQDILAVGGNVFINGSVRYTGGTYYASDRALKKDISPIKNGLKSVLAIEGVQYKWKDSADQGVHFGVIANDLKQVLPNLVDGEPGKMMVAYTELIPVLIQAIKEQQAQIEDLKKIISEKK
jgi:hypothetical protein